MTTRRLSSGDDGAQAQPLHLIWLADCSGSMGYDGKIQALNTAIREAVPHLRRMAEDMPDVSILLRAVRFATGAQWHVANPTPVESFEWRDLTAGGFTDLGDALLLVANDLQSLPPDVPGPVLLLVTDGRPTDDYESALADLEKAPAGHRSIRQAIAIGADADREVLERFVTAGMGEPLRAASPDELVRTLRAATAEAVRVAAERAGANSGRGVPRTDPLVSARPLPIPQDTGDDDDVDVW